MKHLPYEVDPAQSRFHYYEQLWKERALKLVLDRRPQEPGSLFDFGCGRGEMMALAKERGFSVSGADSDPVCVELSSAYGRVDLLGDESLVERYGRDAFDVVSCLHVLEHVKNPAQTLRQLAALSRGLVVVAVPNLRQLTGLSVRRISSSNVNQGHLQGWDHPTLLNLAENHCGLRFVAWAFDATLLSILSGLAAKVCGEKTAIRLETGPFVRIFPFHCHSVIALFEVVR